MNDTKFHTLRTRAGMNLKEFSDMFGIPYRTVQNWDSGERTPPEYVVLMIEYILKSEKLI